MISLNKQLNNNPIRPNNHKEYTKVSMGSECPSCGNSTPDEPIDGYTLYFNYHEFSSDLGHLKYWDEYHICINCGVKYWFESSN